MKTTLVTKWRYGWLIVSLLALFGTSLVVFTAWGENDPTPEPEIPWEVEVYREYCPELTYESYVADCWTGYADEELHIVAVTDTPTLVPAEMDLIPILTVAPPATSPAPLAALPQAVEVYRAVCPALVDEVYIEDCWTGYVDEALHIVVMTDTPALIPAQIGTIPTLTIAPPSDPPTEDDPDSSESDTPGPDTAQSGEPGQESADSDGTDQDTQGTEASPSSLSLFIPGPLPSSAASSGSQPLPALPPGAVITHSSAAVDMYGRPYAPVAPSN